LGRRLVKRLSTRGPGWSPAQEIRATWGTRSNSYYFLLEGQTPPGRQMQFSLLTPKPGDCERKRFGGFSHSGWQRLHELK
jgi:hypothetical protein